MDNVTVCDKDWMGYLQEKHDFDVINRIDKNIKEIENKSELAFDHFQEGTEKYKLKNKIKEKEKLKGKTIW